MRSSILITTLFVALFGTACNSSDRSGSVASDVSADETVVFFKTAAHFDATEDAWHIPIHGWIYEPTNSLVRTTAFAAVLEEQFGLEVTAENEHHFLRRTNLLIADNERGKRVVVRVAGRDFSLPESEENGHFEETVVIPADVVAQHAKTGQLRFEAVMHAGDERQFAGVVSLLPPIGLSVISDIDDTVKISNVTDRQLLLQNTFLLEFSPAPGMADLYRHWASAGASFHYVSSSPWQLYEPLLEFLDREGFLSSGFALKSLRFRDETLIDLFKEGTETKPPAIRAILDRFPDREFILVGDSGEQDPEVYAAILRERPQQVRAIFIRNVTGESADDARFKTVFDGIDRTRWQLFVKPPSFEEAPANDQ